MHDVTSPHPDHRGDAEGGDELHDGGREPLVLDVPAGEVVELPVFLPEAADLAVLQAKGLHHLDAGVGLLEDAGQVPHLLLPLTRNPLDPLADLGGGDHGERDHHEGDQGELPVTVEDDAEKGDGREPVAEDAAYDVGDPLLHHPDVGQDARHERAGLVAVEVTDAQAHVLLVQVVSHVLHR